MSQRLTNCFNNLKKQQKKGLLTFNMAFDPDEATSLEILQSLPDAGADIVEFGMPFSDPMADGPTIQEASIRALKAGAKSKKILSLAAKFRQHNNTTPLILMGYLNPIMHYGMESFVSDAVNAGADGLIIVDLPPEEDHSLAKLCQKHDIALIKLVTPTTDKTRLQTILKHASGFIYYVAVAGVTGTKSSSAGDIKPQIDMIRQQTNLPIAVGFGIKDANSAQAMAQHADAVVVGSSLVKLIAKKQNTSQLVKSLADAIHDEMH